MKDKITGKTLNIAMLGGGKIKCKKVQLIHLGEKMSGRKYKQISYGTKCDMEHKAISFNKGDIESAVSNL